MEVRTYCDSLERHLSDWKTKIYDAIRIVDRLSHANKETVYPTIRGLHAIVDEIDSEVEQLRTACPADWLPNRQRIDARMAELQQTLKNLSEDIGGPLVPDSLAWVSK